MRSRHKRALLGIASLLLALLATACSGLTPGGGSSGAGSHQPVFDPQQKPITNVESRVDEPIAKKLEDDTLSGSLQEETVDRTTFPKIKEYDGGFTKNGYESLISEALKTAYRRVGQAAYCITPTISQEGYYAAARFTVKQATLSESELKLVLLAFRNDNPQVFWLSNVFRYAPSQGDTIVELYSYYDAESCNRMIKRFNGALGEMIGGIGSGLSPFKRELYAHNALLLKCEYDEEVATGKKDRRTSFTAYGAIVEGKAVCQGYALALRLLLSYVGIDSMVITGAAGGTPHAWNVVMIDGAWYHVDATWNDYPKLIRYDYFNINDAALRLDHLIDPEYASLLEAQREGSEGMAPVSFNLKVPACTAVAANYFKREAIPVGQLDENTDALLIERLAAMTANKQTSFSMQFTGKDDYEQALERMFLKEPYKLFYVIDQVNAKPEVVNKISKNGITYAETRTQRAVTVTFRYESDEKTNDG